MQVATQVRRRFAGRQRPEIIEVLALLGLPNHSIAQAAGVQPAVVSLWRCGFQPLTPSRRRLLVELLATVVREAQTQVEELRGPRQAALRWRLRQAEDILAQEQDR